MSFKPEASRITCIVHSSTIFSAISNTIAIVIKYGEQYQKITFGTLDQWAINILAYSLMCVCVFYTNFPFPSPSLYFCDVFISSGSDLTFIER